MSTDSTTNMITRIIGNTAKEGKGENQFAQPRGICIDDATKEIFIVDCNNHRIQVYHLNSLAYIRQIGKGIQGNAAGSLNYAVGICMDDSSNLFVADTNNHRVCVFNRVTGVHIRSIGSQGSSSGALSSPYGVCVDCETGLLYVADYDNNRIQVFDKESGTFIHGIGSGAGSGPGQMNQPIVVCIDKEKSFLLVADYSNNRIQVFNKDTGEYIRHFGDNQGANSLHGPRGLHLNEETKLLFVSDRENHRVQIYNSSNYTFLRNIGHGMGLNPGQFHRPMELCVNLEEGVLLVVDGYNHRVQILEIPELQAEKIRIKASAKSRADAEKRGKMQPKPSLLAVGTNLINSTYIISEFVDGSVRLSFPKLGRRYDLFLAPRDITLLHAHINAISSSPQNHANPVADCQTDSSHEGVTHPNQTMPQQLRRQADAYITILSELCAEDVPCGDAFLYASPALFALHSLLSRGWSPEYFPANVISLLINFLSNIECGIVTEYERHRVLSAIIGLIKAVLKIDESIVFMVLDALLDGFSRCPSFGIENVMKSSTDNRYSIMLPQEEQARHNESTGDRNGSNTPNTPRPHPIANTTTFSKSPTAKQRSTFPLRDSSANRSGLMVLYAYFDLLQEVFQSIDGDSRDAKQTNSLDRKCKQDQFDNLLTLQNSPLTVKGDGNDRDGKKSVAPTLRELLNFVYGSSFVSSLLELHSNKSERDSDNNKKELKIIYPPLDTITSVHTLSNNSMIHTLSQRATLRSQDGYTSQNSNAETSDTDSSSTRDVSIPSEFHHLLKIVFRIKTMQRQTDGGGDKNDILHDLRIELFEEAQQYFSKLITHELQYGYVGDDQSARKLFGAGYERRSRGGRNIWCPDEPLHPGDLVDAMDKEKCWFESIVLDIMPDRSVKIHFMGWGSKWDDIIKSDELPLRLAPLNTQTKNWRADLFTGGLIEIKCNDDLVNQKWMWGKITALNLEDAWVEVTYSFSNEPVVIKRAWLYGETICPVGMHTKDKSKAAAAQLVKPLKKVEDIIREKSQESMQKSEAMFFDCADDYDESVDEEIHQRDRLTFVDCLQRNNVQNDIHVDGMNSVICIAKTVFECVMTELCSVVSQLIGSKENENSDIATPMMEGANCLEQLFGYALKLIRAIAMSPYKKLLVPFFTRPIIFQSGVKAKIISGGFLASKFKNMFDSSSDFLPVTQLLKRFESMKVQYSALITKSLGAALSQAAIDQVCGRIQSTIDRCGITQIANDLIDYIIKQPALKFEIFHKFMTAGVSGGDRFSGEGTVQMRKVLSYLFKSASKAESIKFQSLFESTLIKVEVANIDFTPRLDTVFHYTIRENGVKVDLCPISSERTKMINKSWAMSLVNEVVKIFETAQSVSRVEAMHLPQCYMAAERAIQREFLSLSFSKKAVFAQAVAISLNSLLDFEQETDQICRSMRLDSTERVLLLLKILLDDEMIPVFQSSYEKLMSDRLLSTPFPDCAAELNVLDSLPIRISSCYTMIRDLQSTEMRMKEFCRYFLNQLDSIGNDSRTFGTSDQVSNLTEIILARNDFRVSVLNGSAWPALRSRRLFRSIKLPAIMSELTTKFESYFSSPLCSRVSSDGDIASSMKLTWCYGLGKVTILVKIDAFTSIEVVLNEAQVTVLFAFNSCFGSMEDTVTIKKNVLELSRSTGLCIDSLRMVLRSMMICEMPLLELHAENDLSQRDYLLKAFETPVQEFSSMLVTLSPNLFDIDHLSSIESATMEENDNYQVSFADEFDGGPISDSLEDNYQDYEGDRENYEESVDVESTNCMDFFQDRHDSDFFSRKPMRVVDFTKSFYQNISGTEIAAVEGWRREKIDSAIMRVLKRAYVSEVKSQGVSITGFLYVECMVISTMEQLSPTSMTASRHEHCTRDEIIERADHLASQGYIDKIFDKSNVAQSYGYAYMSESGVHNDGIPSMEAVHCDNSEASIETCPANARLFREMCVMLDTDGVTRRKKLHCVGDFKEINQEKLHKEYFSEEGHTETEEGKGSDVLLEAPESAFNSSAWDQGISKEVFNSAVIQWSSRAVASEYLIDKLNMMYFGSADNTFPSLTSCAQENLLHSIADLGSSPNEDGIDADPLLSKRFSSLSSRMDMGECKHASSPLTCTGINDSYGSCDSGKERRSVPSLSFPSLPSYRPSSCTTGLFHETKSGIIEHGSIFNCDTSSPPSFLSPVRVGVNNIIVSAFGACYCLVSNLSNILHKHSDTAATSIDMFIDIGRKCALAEIATIQVESSKIRSTDWCDLRKFLFLSKRNEKLRRTILHMYCSFLNVHSDDFPHIGMQLYAAVVSANSDADYSDDYIREKVNDLWDVKLPIPISKFYPENHSFVDKDDTIDSTKKANIYADQSTLKIDMPASPTIHYPRVPNEFIEYLRDFYAGSAQSQFLQLSLSEFVYGALSYCSFRSSENAAALWCSVDQLRELDKLNASTAADEYSHHIRTNNTMEGINQVSGRAESRTTTDGGISRIDRRRNRIKGKLAYISSRANKEQTASLQNKANAYQYNSVIGDAANEGERYLKSPLENVLPKLPLTLLAGYPLLRDYNMRTGVKNDSLPFTSSTNLEEEMQMILERHQHHESTLQQPLNLSSGPFNRTNFNDQLPYNDVDTGLIDSTVDLREQRNASALQSTQKITGRRDRSYALHNYMGNLDRWEASNPPAAPSHMRFAAGYRDTQLDCSMQRTTDVQNRNRAEREDYVLRSNRIQHGPERCGLPPPLQYMSSKKLSFEGSNQKFEPNEYNTNSGTDSFDTGSTASNHEAGRFESTNMDDVFAQIPSLSLDEELNIFAEQFRNCLVEVFAADERVASGTDLGSKEYFTEEEKETLYERVLDHCMKAIGNTYYNGFETSLEKTPYPLLWFLCSDGSKLSLAQILQSAFSLLDLNEDGYISSADFVENDCLVPQGKQNNIAQVSFQKLLRILNTDEELNDEQNLRDLKCGIVVSPHDRLSFHVMQEIDSEFSFVHMVLGVAAAMKTSIDDALRVLVEYDWMPNEFLSTLFIANKSIGKNNDTRGASYRRLSEDCTEKRAALSRQGKTGCRKQGSKETELCKCNNCNKLFDPSHLFSLRGCSHYACAKCWKQHIEFIHDKQLPYVTCVTCTFRNNQSACCSNICSEVDFIRDVAGEQMAENFFGRRLRHCFSDYLQAVKSPSVCHYYSFPHLLTKGRKYGSIYKCLVDAGFMTNIRHPWVLRTKPLIEDVEQLLDQNNNRVLDHCEVPLTPSSYNPRTYHALGLSPYRKLHNQIKHCNEGVSSAPASARRFKRSASEVNSNVAASDIIATAETTAENRIGAYLSDTRPYVSKKIEECEQQLACTYDENQFWFLTNRKRIWQVYLQAMSFIDATQNTINAIKQDKLLPIERAHQMKTDLEQELKSGVDDPMTIRTLDSLIRMRDHLPFSLHHLRGSPDRVQLETAERGGNSKPPNLRTSQNCRSDVPVRRTLGRPFAEYEHQLDHLRDMLILTNIKMKNKWNMREHLSSTITRDALHGIRLLMQSVCELVILPREVFSTKSLRGNSYAQIAVHENRCEDSLVIDAKDFECSQQFCSDRVQSMDQPFLSVSPADDSCFIMQHKCTNGANEFNDVKDWIVGNKRRTTFNSGRHSALLHGYQKALSCAANRRARLFELNKAGAESKIPVISNFSGMVASDSDGDGIVSNEIEKFGSLKSSNIMDYYQTRNHLQFESCRSAVSGLRGYAFLDRAAIMRHLTTIKNLCDAGCQPLLIAAGSSTLLLTILHDLEDDIVVCGSVCIVLEKLCSVHSFSCKQLLDQMLWPRISAVLHTHCRDAELALYCCRIVVNILSSNDENKRYSLEQFNEVQMYSGIRSVLQHHDKNKLVCQCALQAAVYALDKSFTKDSAFVRSGLFEVFITSMTRHINDFDGIKIQFAIAVGRLTSSNKFMQEELIRLNVFSTLIDIIYHDATEDPKLIKWVCWALGALVGSFNSAQSKFASMGGCKAICHALQEVNDISSLTYIIRAIAALSLRNQYVQDCFQLEHITERLQEKRMQMQTVNSYTESYDVKSKLNLLFLTYDYALDSMTSDVREGTDHKPTKEQLLHQLNQDLERVVIDVNALDSPSDLEDTDANSNI